MAPWLWGWYGDPKICYASIFSRKLSKVWLVNSFPLSDWRYFEYPLINTCSNAFLSGTASLFRIRITQTYFEKWSTHVKRYLNISFIFSSFANSTKSTWYLSYCFFDLIYFITLFLFWKVCIFYLIHWFTYCLHSKYILGQYQ